ncbi:hypothetical protein BCD48_32660 [Pseudofrankia sp. BMG5.36]|nr:hypothetical protein BCD48_32660 [Pseudofrankia sp. BMG5.36]
MLIGGHWRPAAVKAARSLTRPAPWAVSVASETPRCLLVQHRSISPTVAVVGIRSGMWSSWLYWWDRVPSVNVAGAGYLG